MSNQLLEENAQTSKKGLSSIVDSTEMPQFERIPVKGYEYVVKVTQPSVGLTAIIAIHNTVLGPALGGTRIKAYKNFDEALDDVLRLSKGMTFKSAVSEVGFGGGKSVIIADPAKKTPELLRAFGRAVDKLNGQYICAEDMGCTTADVKIIHETTKYVVGLPHEKSSGDPGRFTAFGVFRGIQATVKRLYMRDSLDGVTVAIQGLGNVGHHLLEHLFWAGAKLIISDQDMEKAKKLAPIYGAQVVTPDEILEVECDILAPCAIGAIINDDTILRFRCKAIAGAANNQLAKDSHADALYEKGILYAPDFVLNSGGLLNVSAEIEEEGYDPLRPRKKIFHIYDTIGAIFEISEKNKESTHAAALSLADYRIKYGIGKRIFPPTFHHSV